LTERRTQSRKSSKRGMDFMQENAFYASVFHIVKLLLFLGGQRSVVSKDSTFFFFFFFRNSKYSAGGSHVEYCGGEYF